MIDQIQFMLKRNLVPFSNLNIDVSVGLPRFVCCCEVETMEIVSRYDEGQWVVCLLILCGTNPAQFSFVALHQNQSSAILVAGA